MSENMHRLEQMKNKERRTTMSNIIISSLPSLAANIEDHKPDGLITMLDPGAWEDLPDNLDEVLWWHSMSFLDKEDAMHPDGPKWKHINDIVDFLAVKDPKGDAKIICCCNGGISRSSSTAI